MSLPVYRNYRDTGVAWFGEVPTHWNVRRLGYFFDERREKVSDAEFAPLSVTRAGIVPQLENVAKTDDGGNRKKVCAGDFVINGRSDRKGSSGASAMDGSCSLISIVLCPNDGIRIDFAHHLMRSVPFQEEFYRYGKGIVADLWSTNYSEMKNISLAVPPSDEQSAIAAFLDRETGKIDALIAEQEKLLTLLAEKRQATISHAVTRGLTTLPGADLNATFGGGPKGEGKDSPSSPNAPMKDSGVPWLGEVPAHWKVTRLKFVASVQTGIAKGKDNQGKETITVPYLRVANVQDGHLALEQITMIDIEPEQLDRYRLQVGDVLMNEGGDFDKLGRGAIWNGEIDDCIHQNHVFAVRPHAVSSRWLNQITGSRYAQFYFMGRSKQSTNLASISSTNIMELPVLLPPVEDQAAILAFLDNENARLDALYDSSTQAISLLKERRSALIAAAVTGKIDVRSTSQTMEEACA